MTVTKKIALIVLIVMVITVALDIPVLWMPQRSVVPWVCMAAFFQLAAGLFGFLAIVRIRPLERSRRQIRGAHREEQEVEGKTPPPRTIE